MDEILRAIAEPHRRQILILVRDVELSAGDIAERFDVTRPAISQHLKVLREAELLNERRVGRCRYYRARVERLQEVRVYLEIFEGAGPPSGRRGEPGDDSEPR